MEAVLETLVETLVEVVVEAEEEVVVVLLQTKRRVRNWLGPTATGSRPELGTHWRNGESPVPKYH